ncbi:MAG: hypothetical protein ACTSXV_00140 [Alphaproteobacteria bacterium]
MKKVYIFLIGFMLISSSAFAQIGLIASAVSAVAGTAVNIGTDIAQKKKQERILGASGCYDPATNTKITDIGAAIVLPALDLDSASKKYYLKKHAK